MSCRSSACRRESGGELKSVRNLGYSTNGELIKNQIVPEKDGYTIECLVHSRR